MSSLESFENDLLRKEERERFTKEDEECLDEFVGKLQDAFHFGKKNLDKNLSKIGVKKINAQTGTVFNPELHEAVQFDEASDGDREIVAAELRTGYVVDGDVLRASMVKVARK